MDELHKEILALQYKVRDRLDKPNDPVARQLTNELQRLEDETQVHKNARSVEDRVKQIIRLLEGPVEHAQVMSYEHIQELHHHMLNIQMQLRRMS